MDTFEIVVLSIAIMLLVIILGVFVYFMTNVAKSTEWPPVVSNCPDFWENIIYNDGDVSRNICVDRNETIDPKCKTFAGPATTTSVSGAAGILADNTILNQDGNDAVTMNKYLVYRDGSNDSDAYKYSGYNDEGEHELSSWTNFQQFYSLDVSGQNGSSGYSNADYTSISGISNIASDNLARINTDSANTKIHVSFNLSDTDKETARDLTKEKRRWATNCGVSWDGITS